ncbi:T9SS type A sorting domain-containing protein [Bacteroidota bacterium]
MVVWIFNINYYTANFNTEINAFDKSKTYLIYCGVGGRSAQAINYMNNNGFVEVYNMLGGINQWINSGFPIVISTSSTSIIIDKNNINIYPNPSDNYINISFKNEINHKLDLHILNSLGEMVLRKNYYNISMNTRIDLSGLMPGIYFVKIQIQNSMFVKRLILN